MSLPTQTAIGATVNIRREDSTEELVFEEYISLGEYIEDDETDTFGVSDLTIFYYVKDLAELEGLKYSENNREWLLTEIIEVHYA